jgi:hypothetical protein
VAQGLALAIFLLGSVLTEPYFWPDNEEKEAAGCAKN